MGLLDSLLSPQNSGALKQIAGQLGMGESDAADAMKQLLPALSQGMNRNLQQPGGMGNLLGALQRGNHQQYVERPETLGRDEAVADGNAILGHLLGSKDASRRVAANAAGSTGLDEGLLKKMLPMVAAMVMGAVSKQTGGGAAAPTGGDSALGGMLTSFLDADKDGSVMDDVLDMAKKLF